MAFDPKPSSWLDNWSEDGTDITLPIASLPELTAAEADADSGDIRKVMFAFCEKIYQEWNERPAIDRPTQMVVTKSATQNVATGTVINTYTFRFETEIVSQEVEDEPA